jgi:predicted dehydrogenase
MISRKKFLKTAGLGAASLPLTTNLLANSALLSPDALDDEIDLRIGIIGAENSHSWNFGIHFNIEKQHPGARVTHIWGETDEFARISAEKGKIPTIVKDPLEMMGHIDALIVDHRDGKFHLDAAYPFIEKRIPTFVDKPFCIKASEGKKFLEAARKYKTPVSSLSTIAYSRTTDKIKADVNASEKIGQAVIYGPGKVNSVYNGVYYYVVHSLQTITRIFGENIKRVRVTGSEQNVITTLEYENGFIATMIFIEAYYGFLMNIETNKGMMTYEPTWKEENSIFHRDLVKMFRTGEEPRAYQSILNEVSVLEAIAKSVESQEWEEVGRVEIDEV